MLVVSHEVARRTIQRAQHKRDIVCVCRVARQVKELDANRGTEGLDQFEEFTHLLVGETVPTKLLAIFEQRIVRVEQRVLSALSAVKQFAIWARRVGRRP